MAKTRQDHHPIQEWYLDWVVTGTHHVDVPGAPFRDYHTILWAQRFFYPSPPPDAPCFIIVYDEEKAHKLALSLVANPDLLTDMCLNCHWPYYRLQLPRWNILTPPPSPPRYLTWPDNHLAIVPACISWDENWSWDPYPTYPWA